MVGLYFNSHLIWLVVRFRSHGLLSESKLNRFNDVLFLYSILSLVLILGYQKTNDLICEFLIQFLA